jgi:large subunit ribosomal protein L10
MRCIQAVFVFKALFKSATTILTERRNLHVAISKEKKATLYSSYESALGDAIGMVVAEYRGMRMKDISAIRKELRPLNAKLIVVKSAIFRKNLANHGFAVPEKILKGPIAVAVANDLPKVTKALLSLKDQPLFVLKGAIMGQTVFEAAQLEALSTMPTFEEARASLIGLIQTPAQQLVSVLSQPANGVARVLKAYTDKQEGGAA